MSTNICFSVLPNQHDVSCWPTYQKNNYQFFNSSLTCSKSGLLTESYISHLTNCIAYNLWNNPIHCSVYIIFKIVKPSLWFWILILIEQNKKKTNKKHVYIKPYFQHKSACFYINFFLMKPPFHYISRCAKLSAHCKTFLEKYSEKKHTFCVHSNLGYSFLNYGYPIIAKDG